MPETLRLNLGCGECKLDGYVNVDKCGEPDVRLDLEVPPWPWETSSVDEVRLTHVLEHLGQHPVVYQKIIQELYRVCAPDAKVHIAVPHFRHDNFASDPTHVRVITPDGMKLLSKRLNREWTAKGAANSPLGLYWDVDFELEALDLVPDRFWLERFDEGRCTRDEITAAMVRENNVIAEIRMVLRVVKGLE